MTADEYKQVKNKENILDFSTLNLTRQYLEQVGSNGVAEEVSQILIHNKVEKPALHNRQQEIHTDFYYVNLTSSSVEIITSMLIDFEAASVTETGESTTLTAHYSGMLDRWSNLQ
ncbi:hypothetical protein J7E24_03155 [Hymenobacter sp. ISL-91]|uniref:hypothetical protein n=1 Tax=Hymenobacter sp. ISL-91 TaxID=2819151 RepID=UPI001BEBFAE8|nr:hypothetical protein [Hymenobacter sp. ISL-91]MBT2556768.1 hypothetical protein [Hymenobacter sp. ISL-91]